MVKTMLAVVFLGAISVGAAQAVPAAPAAPVVAAEPVIGGNIVAPVTSVTLQPVFTTAPFITAAPVVAAPTVTKTQCAVDGVAAVDDMSDAAMFVWAASKRCGNPADSQVKCEIDIASAAQSASNMIATIAGAVAECGAVNADADCAASVSGLTGAAAGLAAASGAIISSCPNSLNIPHGLPDAGTDQLTNLGNCIFDAKDALRSLFDASKSMSEAAKRNTGEANTAVNVMAALAGMGSSLAASVSDCSSVNGGGNDKADCASAVLALVSSLNEVALAGKELKQGCNAGAARLYVEDAAWGKKKKHNDEEIATGSSSLPLALAAFLPMAAALSFAAGRYTRTSYRSLVASDEEAAMLAPE